MKSHLQLVSPRNINRKVTPSRLSNAKMRAREYLLKDELDAMLKAAKQGRYPDRDVAMVLIAYRHGLRAQEIVDLEWSQVEFGRNARLHVRRVKGGVPSVHPLQGDEIRALRKLEDNGSKYIFATERGGPFTTDAINRQIKTIGVRAALPFPVHAHMLRHTCGYMLAGKGHSARHIQDWLGHVSITHTVKYTALSTEQFKDFWQD
jgi:integrase